MKKTVAQCDCCPSPATEEVNLEGGHTLDFCDACVLSPPAMQLVLKMSAEIRSRRSYGMIQGSNQFNPQGRVG